MTLIEYVGDLGGHSEYYVHQAMVKSVVRSCADPKSFVRGVKL